VSRPWAERRLHLIGIGGAGMSGLAAACLRLGATVSGSDRARSSYTERLEGLGAEVTIGHQAENLPEGAEVIVSTAIAADNPELQLARERGQTVRHRGELLAELCAEKRLIAIAGTHGKTTTTAMITWALRGLDQDPAFFVGGEIPLDGTTNAAWGEGEWVVAEADESDGSFLKLKPEIAVITNIELDHHSHWRGLAELKRAFAEFAAPARTVIAGPEVEIGDTDWVRFSSTEPGPAQLELAVPGQHNRLNARGAIAALIAAGFDPAAAAGALVDFPGVKRRLEFKGEREGARVYDDYAHHPTEVRAAPKSPANARVRE
jgi:UDP-N-acetylmuramate--alanine ligase